MNEQASISFRKHDELRVRRGLRVLQVIDADPFTYPPTINAARALAQAGAQVRCLSGITLGKATLEMPANTTIRYAEFGSWKGRGLGKARWTLGRFQFRSAVMMEAKSFDPQLVIAYDHGAIWAALGLANSGRRKVIMHLHDNTDAERVAWYSIRAMQWRASVRHAETFDARVVPARERVDHIRAVWGGRGAYDVVANSPIRRSMVRNSLLRQQLGIRSEEPIAISIGNIGLLSQSAAALAQTRSRWHLVSVGATDKNEVAQAAERSIREGVSDRFHVLPYTAYDTVCAWLQGCEVGLAFYPLEGTTINWRTMGTASVKLMEYLAAGLPVIVTHQSSFDDLNAEIGALHIIKENSSETIAHALDALDPLGARWSKVSSAARAAHETRFNMETQLKPLLTSLGLAEWD